MREYSNPRFIPTELIILRYKSVLEKFERLALVKTDFGNNVDYADKINAERTTICLYPAPESNKNGSNSFSGVYSL